MSRELGRRAFLATLGGAALAAGAAACGGGSHQDLVLLPNDWEFLTGAPARVGVFIADNAHNAAPVALDSPVTLRIGPQHGPLGPPIRATVHAAGPEPNYAEVTYTFPAPGTYTISATFKGRVLSIPQDASAPSTSATPVIGQAMKAVPTPTVDDHRGVDPICTAQPACPFHTVSLDTALAGRRPVALLFATPALCQSKFCGPVLSNLQAVSGPWRHSVTFIHVEIYKNLTGPTSAPDGNLAPAVQAWGLQHEPMLYLGDPGGRILDRIDNLFDQTAARAALTRAYGQA